MHDNIITQDIKSVLDRLGDRISHHNWILSCLNGTYTLEVKWLLEKPAITPGTNTRAGLLTPPQSAKYTPRTTQANARNTPAQLVTRKYKSPSTRRRDRARLLAWKNSRSSNRHHQDPSTRKCLFQEETSASDNIISDTPSDLDSSVASVSESSETDKVPSPAVDVTLDCDEVVVRTQLVASQVTEAAGSGSPLDSEESNSAQELSTYPAVTAPEPYTADQPDPPEVPFPFTWSERGFLPGGLLPDDKEEVWKALDAGLCEQSDDVLCGSIPKLDSKTTELIKLALHARNQHFLERCFANDCNNLVDHKIVCRQCKIAKYCCQECAVFDLAHKGSHHIYTELSPCAAIEQLEDVVVNLSVDLWDPSAAARENNFTVLEIVPLYWDPFTVSPVPLDFET